MLRPFLRFQARRCTLALIGRSRVSARALARLLFPPPDGTGIDVAISGSTIVVGSRAEKAYVYDTATGNELYTLTAYDAEADDGFGAHRRDRKHKPPQSVRWGLR